MPRMMHLTLAAVVAAASTSSMLACDVGERQEVSCGANSVCCKYQNYVEPSMTLWSCFKGTDNITASSICRRANGTVVGSGACCYCIETCSFVVFLVVLIGALVVDCPHLVHGANLCSGFLSQEDNALKDRSTTPHAVILRRHVAAVIRSPTRLERLTPQCAPAAHSAEFWEDRAKPWGIPLRDALAMPL